MDCRCLEATAIIHAHGCPEDVLTSGSDFEAPSPQTAAPSQRVSESRKRSSGESLVARIQVDFVTILKIQNY
jgi:hypothetical protein